MIGKLFWICVSTILYTYLGYPVLLTLLARIRPNPKSYLPTSTPTVTLLIAAHNEQVVIAEKLENSLALEYPRRCLQILVAADGSNDRTPDIVRTYAGRGVELSYDPPRRGKMAAINRAMSQVRGEIVIFSDANNMYEPDVLQKLVAPFSDATVGAVTGTKLIKKGDGVLGDSEGLYWRYESFIKQQETRLGCCTAVAGEVLAVRRDLIEAPSDNIINDDFYLALRLVRRGYRVVYTPHARSWERVSLSAREEMTRRARIVAGRYQAMALAPQLLPFRRPLLTWQVLSHKFLRPLVPVAMIGALFANVMTVLRPPRAGKQAWLRLAPPFNRIILLGQLFFYGLAWLGNSLQRRGRWGKLLYLPTFLVNSNLAALVGLYRALTKNQTSLWQRVQRREGMK